MKKNLVFILILLMFVSNIYALSNEAIETKQALDSSLLEIQEMSQRNIPLERVNETYKDAFQLYSAQLNFELTGRKAHYNIVNELIEEIIKIKKASFIAQDELLIFIETYEEVLKESDLSEIQEDYDEILKSFEDQRFEETPELINKGYDTLSEIQSSQTALNVFYTATTQTLKNFLIKNWIKLTIIFLIIIIVLFIFWKAISRIRVKVRLSNLKMQKETINKLIKNIQRDYFKKKTLSDIEYKIKLKEFERMTLEINRQIPILKEQLLRLGKEHKENKNKKKAFVKKIRKQVKKDIKEERRVEKINKKKKSIRKKSSKKKTIKKKISKRK